MVGAGSAAARAAGDPQDLAGAARQEPGLDLEAQAGEERLRGGAYEVV